MTRLYLAVALGAGLGSLMRFGVYAAAPFAGAPPFAATVFVNALGSFVIGLFAALTGPKGRTPLAADKRNFVMGGICGGFTTFSSMSLDAFFMLDARRPTLAAAYLTTSVVLSLASTWIGWAIATRLNRQKLSG